MFTITCLKGIVNYNETPPYTYWNVSNPDHWPLPHAHKGADRSSHSLLVGCEVVQLFRKTVLQFLTKVNILSPYGSAVAPSELTWMNQSLHAPHSSLHRQQQQLHSTFSSLVPLSSSLCVCVCHCGYTCATDVWRSEDHRCQCLLSTILETGSFCWFPLCTSD